MMDFNGMGLRMGFSEALARQARDADAAIEEANEIIARKNRRIGELKDSVDGLGQRVDALASELAASRRQVAAAETARAAREAQIEAFFARVQREHAEALAVEECRREAAWTLAKVLSDELKAERPADPEFAPTGLVYPGGAPQSKLRQLFDQAFDTLMAQRGIPDPQRHRPVAGPPHGPRGEAAGT